MHKFFLKSIEHFTANTYNLKFMFIVDFLSISTSKRPHFVLKIKSLDG
jgi:hypothetical protein